MEVCSGTIAPGIWACRRKMMASASRFVNHNVLYHSLPGVGKRREILATCLLRGLLNSLACREPDANNLNETLGVAIESNVHLCSKPREEIWRKRSRI